VTPVADADLINLLVCPRDRVPLRPGAADELVCPAGHVYPVVAGIPVLLLEDAPPTHAVCERSLQQAHSFADTLDESDAAVDPFVQQVIAATGGRLYAPLIGRLREYPIPDLRLPPGEGRRLLELGCNWGRWCVAAARKGYVAFGVDPSLEAVAAARRVAAQLGEEGHFIVADARHLPFPDGIFDDVFSYSVLQHFGKADVLATLDEIARVLVPGGMSVIQMANALGVRSLMNQVRERRVREPRLPFDVRYWTVRELRAEFSSRIGPSVVEAEGFLSLNAQTSDLALLPSRYRLLVRTSDLLRRLARSAPPLVQFADSVYVRSNAARRSSPAESPGSSP
jgi:ubiquinone/menaquinone biosynthesis C-methylase UbiE/uncharacterized protein YbaR (Trm112 family)